MVPYTHGGDPWGVPRFRGGRPRGTRSFDDLIPTALRDNSSEGFIFVPALLPHPPKTDARFVFDP